MDDPRIRRTVIEHRSTGPNIAFWIGILLIAILAFSALVVILNLSNYVRYTNHRLTFDSHGSTEHPNGLYYRNNAGNTREAQTFLASDGAKGDFLLVGPQDSGTDHDFTIVWKASDGLIYYHNLLGTLST